jgi:hypothetical protein
METSEFLTYLHRRPATRDLAGALADLVASRRASASARAVALEHERRADRSPDSRVRVAS